MKTQKLTFLLAVLFLLVPMASHAQTHQFCPTDATCTWTGPQTFNGPVSIPGNVSVGGTLTGNGTAIPVIGIDPTAAAYGCSTGLTDNSTCLQAAINAAISGNTCLVIPGGGVFAYATTLTVNVGSKGLCLRGKGMQPTISGQSVLKYTGTGTAVSMSNASAFIFGENWNDVTIMAGANATNAISAIDISEFTFRRVGLWDDGNGHQFTNGWNCQGCNIGTWDGWITANMTNGVVLVDTAQSPSASLTFLHADTFKTTNVFVVSGQGNNISDIAGWHETQNTIMLIDDTSKVTGLVGVYFDNTRALFNGALATYPDSVFLKINNVAGNVMTLHQINLDHATYLTNQAVTYPNVITLANASSIVWLGVGGNSSFQGASTGFINTTLAGGITQLRFNIYGLESLNASLTPLSTLAGGTGASFTDVEFGGITSNGNISLNANSSFLSVGATPAASGSVRLANNIPGVMGRNAANNADITMLTLDGSNNINIGGAHFTSGGALVTPNAQGVFANPIISQTGTTAATGFIRANAADTACWRNAANSADVCISKTTDDTFLSDIRLTSFTNATLGTPANGTIRYCSDCTIANPCAGAGTGALAKRINATWICN